MCSIIGILSKKGGVGAPIVESLRRMEYRGYDSVGVATLLGSHILVRKGIGKVNQVNNGLGLAEMQGTVGIGHTRWATHGGVTNSNAHPHSCCSGEIAVVHNGIIENYAALKEQLAVRGHVFRSETDTEVIAHLLEESYAVIKEVRGAVKEAVRHLEGSFAFVALFANGTLACARMDEPLVIGVSDSAYYASSDVLGFLQYTDQAIFLENGDIAVIDASGIAVSDFDGKKVSREVTKVAWELAAASKGEYAHYTIKEIFEQKETVSSATFQQEHKVNAFCEILSNARNIVITGSGTSYHTSLLLSSLGSRFAKKRFTAVMASEFQYNLDLVDSETVVVGISQSGETADVLSSIKYARGAGAKVASIVNVPTSSLARVADASLSVNCGPEIGVAATKSFTSQLSLGYAILDRLSGGRLGFDKSLVASAISKTLEHANAVNELVSKIAHVNDVYVLGRSNHFPVALEGALKLKELAYVHAEGIAAGELKHGPLALMDSNAYVIVLNPRDETYEDTLNSAHEVKARGAKIIAISDEPSEIYDAAIKIPRIENPALYPIVEVVPLQLLSYYLSLHRNADPDFPRNLAKSVTVK